MIRRTLMFAAMALAMQGAVAKDWDSIRFATEGAYPPFNTVDTSGAVQGFDVDVANALCEEMKAKCTWVKQEWDGMIPALLSRKFDAISASMSITEERKKRVDFTDKYYSTPLGLVSKKGSGLVPELDVLKGKRIGVQRATTTDRFASSVMAAQGVQVVRYSSQNEIYLDLISGRLDGTLADAIPVEEGFLKTPNGKGFAFVGPSFTDPAYFGEGAGIAVRKGDSELLGKLNAAIAAIRASGEYQQIQQRYFSFDIYGD